MIEDDRKIATAVKRGLESEGYMVEVAFDGADGLWMATEGLTVILDIALLTRNGFEICADLDPPGPDAILMLTAKHGDPDVRRHSTPGRRLPKAVPVPCADRPGPVTAPARGGPRGYRAGRSR